MVVRFEALEINEEYPNKRTINQNIHEGDDLMGESVRSLHSCSKNRRDVDER